MDDNIGLGADIIIVMVRGLFGHIAFSAKPSYSETNPHGFGETIADIEGKCRRQHSSEGALSQSIRTTRLALHAPLGLESRLLLRMSQNGKCNKAKEGDKGFAHSRNKQGLGCLFKSFQFFHRNVQ